MAFSLQGKLAVTSSCMWSQRGGPLRVLQVITGGASGIGLAITELFAKQGAIVAIIDLANSASVRHAQ